MRYFVSLTRLFFSRVLRSGSSRPVLAAVALSLAFNIAVAAETSQMPVMEYRYWDWGATPLRDSYQVELLTLALEKTRAEFGDYRIVRVAEKMTSARGRRELNRGNIINIQAAPWRPVKGSGFEPALRIEIPLYKGLLGYRYLIIRREDATKFSSIASEDELKALEAGQGRDWMDVRIYRLNGYPVNDNANIDTLLSMLKAKRFDYVPMSIVEAQAWLDKTPGANEALMVARHPLLYFPFPFVFFVSINEPTLAERVDKGLTLAQRDGSFDALFNRYFGSYVQAIRRQTSDYFPLRNPLLPETYQENPKLLGSAIGKPATRKTPAPKAIHSKRSNATSRKANTFNSDAFNSSAFSSKPSRR